MYTGFSAATVNPPLYVTPFTTVATGLTGTFPIEPSTSLKTWRAPLTQFLRPVVLQLAIRALAAVPKGSGGAVLLICVFRFVVVLACVPQKPNPRFCAPQLSMTPFSF